MADVDVRCLVSATSTARIDDFEVVVGADVSFQVSWRGKRDGHPVRLCVSVRHGEGMLQVPSDGLDCVEQVNACFMSIDLSA